MLAAAMLLVSSAAVQGDGLRLEFDDRMRSRVFVTREAEQALGPFMESEVLRTAQGELSGFTPVSREQDAVKDELGEGRRVTLVGRSGSMANSSASAPWLPSGMPPLLPTTVSGGS